MSKEIVDKIPAEKRWAIAGQAMTGAYSAIIQLLGPIVGKEKLEESNNMVYGLGGKISFPLIKDSFNIPVEDAIGANKLAGVVALLQMGPEFEFETVEESPERVVARTIKCPWWERLQEQKGNIDFHPCPAGHQTWGEEGCKAVNPKLTFKMTKTMPWGDPYCEMVYELK